MSGLARRLARAVGWKRDPVHPTAPTRASSEELARVPRNGTKVFQVVGLARSGTTILSVGLNAHPDVVCLIEPYLAWSKRTPFPYEDDGTERSYAGSPDELVAALCARPDLRWVGFKETFRPPDHEFPSEPFLVENVRSEAVDATLAIVRDPRDVWVSVLTRFPESRRMPLNTSFTDKWNRFVDWTSSADIFRIRYEDLVTDPENAHREIASHLGLRYEATMVRPSGTKGLGDVRAARGGEISSSSVGRFARELSPCAAAFIDAQCIDRMETLGYSPGNRVGFVE